MSQTNTSTVCIAEPKKNQNGKPETDAIEILNPFDVSRLCISQDFQSAAGVKKVINTIPLRKPSKEWFIRTHSDEAYHINTCVIELKEESELYLVDPSLWDSLAGESTFGPRLLITSKHHSNTAAPLG